MYKEAVITQPEERSSRKFGLILPTEDSYALEDDQERRRSLRERLLDLSHNWSSSQRERLTPVLIPFHLFPALCLTNIIICSCKEELEMWTRMTPFTREGTTPMNNNKSMKTLRYTIRLSLRGNQVIKMPSSSKPSIKPMTTRKDKSERREEWRRVNTVVKNLYFRQNKQKTEKNWSKIRSSIIRVIFQEEIRSWVKSLEVSREGECLSPRIISSSTLCLICCSVLVWALSFCFLGTGT